MSKVIKKLSVFFSIFLFAQGAQCDWKDLDASSNDSKNVLIVYYSVSGDTEHIAKLIQSKIGGDIKRLETKKPYPADYEKLMSVVKEQIAEDQEPELKDRVSTEGYDCIIVCSPIWFGDLALPIKTFLDDEEFDGKVVKLCCVTHGGGGIGIAEKELKDELDADDHDGAIVKESFSIEGKGDESTSSKLDIWLKDIG